MYNLKCKLLTGSFPTFPDGKYFVNLPVKEKPVLLHFKKLVQRKEKIRNSVLFLKHFLKNYYFCPLKSHSFNN